jgi:hypothetical protein
VSLYRIDPLTFWEKFSSISSEEVAAIKLDFLSHLNKVSKVSKTSFIIFARHERSRKIAFSAFVLVSFFRFGMR